MPLESPHTAFNLAITRLNNKNLVDLWLTSGLLSCIDYFDGLSHSQNFLMPTVNVENVSMFQRAILRSSSTEKKYAPFTYPEWSYVHNNLISATTRPGLLDGPEPAEVRLRRLLATMANSQFRFQENSIFDRLGRAYALLHVIPTDHRDTLSRLQKDRFLDLPTVIPQVIGMSVKEFLTLGFACIALIGSRFRTNVVVSDELRAYTAPGQRDTLRRHAEVIESFLTNIRQYRDWLLFQATDLLIQDAPITSLDTIHTYLGHFARTTRELREIATKRPEYREGHIPDRLHPLERYPIVRLDDGRYIIPNVRYFVMTLTEGLHYLLQEAYPDDRYNQLRGYIQELYLQALLTDRLPTAKLLPETSYLKAKQRVDGPDMTLIEDVDPVLVAIESKAKRMRIVTRVAPASSALIDDLGRVFKALERLPGKIADLYAQLPEYAAVQTHIDATKGKDPFAWVVVGEGVYLLPELIFDHVQQTPGHFLQTFPYPYGVMALDIFEDAVELAASLPMPLHAVLREYWQNSMRSNDFNSPLAQALSGRTPSNRNRFVLKYVTMLFDGISTPPWERPE